jgi:hypothetical protein
MSQKTIRPIFLTISFCLICLFAAASAVAAQDKPSTVGGAQSDAKKAFEKLKALSGSWQGTIMGISINFTIRAASSGTTILHEATTPGGGPPNHEITMFYVEGDRFLATHYCDAGNRSNMEGKLTADGKGVEFSLLELVGSKKGGFLQRLMFTSTDADRHVVELDFVQPNGKLIPLRGEFQRTKPSQHLSNKRLYDGGTMMLLLSAEKMPEEHYGFKPTSADPGFGQMLADVANWQYKNCSVVLGEKNPKPNIEGKGTSKADLIAALKDGFAYCGKAYGGMTDASAAESVTFSSLMGPHPTSRLEVLNINTGLNALHYGNLMIYMRLKNVVPPSSDPDLLKQMEKLMKK